MSLKRIAWYIYWGLLVGIFAYAIIKPWDLSLVALSLIIFFILAEFAHCGLLNSGRMYRCEAMQADQVPPMKNKYSIKLVAKLAVIPLLYLIVVVCIAALK